MKRNARKAFNALKKIGAPVMETSGWGAEFILSAEDNVDTVWADYYEAAHLERVTENGDIEWAYGINQIVHVILKEYGLMTEWIDPGTVGIYQN